MQQQMRPWAQLSPQERAAARQQYKDLRGLPPEKQDEVRQRWQQYQTLPPEKKEELARQAPPPKPVPQPSGTRGATPQSAAPAGPRPAGPASPPAAVPPAAARRSPPAAAPPRPPRRRGARPRTRAEPAAVRAALTATSRAGRCGERAHAPPPATLRRRLASLLYEALLLSGDGAGGELRDRAAGRAAHLRKPAAGRPLHRGTRRVVRRAVRARRRVLRLQLERRAPHAGHEDVEARAASRRTVRRSSAAARSLRYVAAWIGPALGLAAYVRAEAARARRARVAAAWRSTGSPRSSTATGSSCTTASRGRGSCAD